MSADLERAARALLGRLHYEGGVYMGAQWITTGEWNALRAALPAEGAAVAVVNVDSGGRDDPACTCEALPHYPCMKHAATGLAHPAPADAGAACCQASRRGALEEAVMVAEHMGRGDVAARIRALAQGGSK